MPTIDQILRERLDSGNAQALVGALDLNSNRVLVHFGQLGRLPRLTFQVLGDQVFCLNPPRGPQPTEEDAAHAAARAADPNAAPADAGNPEGAAKAPPAAAEPAPKAEVATKATKAAAPVTKGKP